MQPHLCRIAKTVYCSPKSVDTFESEWYRGSTLNNGGVDVKGALQKTPRGPGPQSIQFCLTTLSDMNGNPLIFFSDSLSRQYVRATIGGAAVGEAGVMDNPVNGERDIRIVGLHVEAPDGGVS